MVTLVIELVTKVAEGAEGRHTRPPRLRGFTMLSRRGTWTDRPPPVVLSCCRGVGADALRPSAGFSACYGISIASHGLRPFWVTLRGCEGIQAYRHKRTPAGCEPVRGFVRYNQRKRGRLWCFQ